MEEGGIRHPTMQLSNQSTRKWNILALSALGVAIAVFAWGLHYKLSLYNSVPVTAHHVSSARILSNRERPADVAVQIEHATPPVFVVFTSISLLLFAGLTDPKRQSRWPLQREQNARRRRISETAPQLFFRPPPSRR